MAIQTGNISESMMNIEILQQAWSFSTMMTSKKVSTADCNDLQPEMAAETRNTWFLKL